MKISGNRFVTKIGIWFVGGSVGLFFVDRFTHLLSNIMGKIFCGDQYMQPVDGVVGDMSCGFNSDMYTAICLLIFAVVGILLILASRK